MCSRRLQQAMCWLAIYMIFFFASAANLIFFIHTYLLFFPLHKQIVLHVCKTLSRRDLLFSLRTLIFQSVMLTLKNQMRFRSIGLRQKYNCKILKTQSKMLSINNLLTKLCAHYYSYSIFLSRNFLACVFLGKNFEAFCANFPCRGPMLMELILKCIFQENQYII